MAGKRGKPEKWVASETKLISLTGFDGGRTAQLASVNLHVAADNYGVIKDVEKTLVYSLAEWLNHVNLSPIIPSEVISKPPSAELRPDQTDQDTLPPYEILSRSSHERATQVPHVGPIESACQEALCIRGG